MIKNLNKKTIVIIAAALIVISGITGFLVGKNTAKPKFNKNQIGLNGQFPGNNFSGGSRMTRGGNFGSTGMFQGEVLSKDASGITLKLNDGDSKVIIVPESANVYKMGKAAINDIEVGQSVSISGKQNEDGSVECRSIQIQEGTPANQAPIAQ